MTLPRNDDNDNCRALVSEQDELTYRRFVSEFSAHLLIAIVNQDGKIIRSWLGDGFANISGYELEEFEASPMLWFDIIHPEDRDRIISAFKRLNDGIPMLEEYRLFRKDGQMQWVRETCVVAENYGEKCSRILGCVVDITQEKASSDRLVQFKQLLDETPYAVTIRDVTGKMIYCNWAAVRMYKYDSLEELQQLSYRDVIPPELLRDFEENKLPMILEGPFSGEYTLRRKNGERFDVNVATNVIRNPDGSPSAYYVIMSDITERKRVERIANESAEMLDVVLNSLPEHIAVLDNESKIISVNEAWKRFARENGDPGLAHSGVGVNYLDVCKQARGESTEGAQEAFDGILAMLKGELQTFEIEYPCHSPDEKRWFVMRATPLLRESGGLVVSHYDITELKLASESLLLFKSAVDAATDGIGLVDASWQSVYINPAHYRMFGFTADEYQRNSVRIAYVDPSKFDNEVLETLRAGHPWQGEVNMKRKNGTHLIVDNHISPVFDPEGKIIAVMAILTDVTERNKTEEELITLSLAMDATTDGIGIIDREKKPFYLNKAMEKMLGYSFQDYVENGVEIGFADKDILDKKIIPAILSGNTWQGEIEMLRRDGVKLIVDMHTVPVLDKNNNLLVLMGIFTDITERKRAEESLLANQQFLKYFVEHTPAAVAMFDKEMRYLAYSKRWMTDYNLKDRDITGLSHYEVFPDIPDRWKEDHKNVLAGAVVQTDEDRFEREDGSVDYLKYEVRPWRDANGEIGGIIMFTEVITDRKLAEDALRESEERFRNVIANVDVVLFRALPNLRMIAIIGNTERISGYTAEEIINDPKVWPGGLYFEDRKRVKKRLSEIVSSKTSGDIDTRVLSKNGRILWKQAQVTPVFDETGQLQFYDGVAIDITERMQARQREARYTQRMRALTEISQKMVSSLDIDEIVRFATQSTSDLLDCMCGIISIEHKDHKIHKCDIQCNFPEIAENISNAVEEMDLTFEKLFGETGIKSRIDADMNDVSSIAAEFAQRAGIGPGIMTPVTAGGELSCILAAFRLKGHPPFEDEDLWFLTEIASHASSAMVNASLYKRQSRIAETLQRSIIPLSPYLKCMDIATRYVPAPGEAEVGGDFFDIIDFQNGKYGIVVGDVSGKGIDAAVHTAEAKYMLRGFALQNPDPEYVMSSLNNGLYMSFDPFVFVTMFYALIDPYEHKITYVNGGHEPPLILCGITNTVKELMPTGKALGIIGGEEYTSVSEFLSNDNLLLCYTDGVTELPVDEGRFGYDRLVEVVSKAPSKTAQDLLDYVIEIVNEAGHGKQADDQVIVVARINV